MFSLQQVLAIMNNQPVVHSISSSNGFPHRRVEKVAQPFVKNTGFVYILMDIGMYIFILI